MKYLHDAALADITTLLSDCPVWSSSTISTDGTNSAAANSRTLHGRLEAYTTKRAGSDKKLAVNVSGRYVAEQEAAVADDKLAALIHFQKEQIQHLTSSSNTSFPSTLTGRKRRSASTGEAPLELQKSRHTLISSPISEGRRGRAYSLDIPKPMNTNDALKTNSDASTLFDDIRTTTSIPPQPNFRALSLAAVNRRLLTDLILTLNHSFPDYDFATAGIADFTVCSVQTAVTRINERLGEFSAATSTTNSSLLKSMATGNGGNLYNDGSSFLSTLWKAVDDVIHLSEVVEVYSYQPSNGELDDPHSFLKHSLVKGGWGEYEYEAVDSGPRINAHGTNQSNQYGGVIRGDDDVSEYDDDDDDDLDDSYSKSRKSHGTPVHREVLWTFNYFFVNKHAKRILLFTCIETMTRSGYSIPPTIPTTFNKFVHGNKTMNFNAIPEHEAVHHQLRYDTTSTSELKRNRSRRRLKYMRQSSPSILPSDEDGSGNENDDDEDDECDGEDYDDDDSHTIASSSAVSVDFDLDPANAVSGGIPIGN